MSYRPLDHTADLGFEIESATLEGLFEDAARAFTGTVTPLVGIRPAETREVRLQADDLDALLVEWLDELLFRFDADGWVAHRVRVRIDSAGGESVALEATLRGERFAPDRHPLGVPIKAVTYHGLEVRRDRDRWRARVIFDI